jgi:hypothetical protein
MVEASAFFDPSSENMAEYSSLSDSKGVDSLLIIALSSPLWFDSKKLSYHGKDLVEIIENSFLGCLFQQNGKVQHAVLKKGGFRLIFPGSIKHSPDIIILFFTFEAENLH